MREGRQGRPVSFRLPATCSTRLCWPTRQTKTPIDRELFARALAQLGKLGSNVNQLAKYGNQGRLVSNKHLKEAAEQIAILRAVFFIAIGRDPGELPPTVRDIIEDDN